MIGKTLNIHRSIRAFPVLFLIENMDFLSYFITTFISFILVLAAAKTRQEMFLSI